MASVASDLENESERLTALWWILVIDMDEPSFREAESSL